MKLLSRLPLLALTWFVICAPLAVQGQATTAGSGYKTAADIPVGEFFRLPRYSQMEISPDGKRLAAVIPHKGRDNLAIIEISNWQVRLLTDLDHVDVESFLWLDNQRIFFSTVDQIAENGAPQWFAGYFAIDTETANARNLRLDDQFPHVLGVMPDGSGDLIVALRTQVDASENVFRMNTRTGRSRKMTFRNPGDIMRWVVDKAGAVRVALRENPRESADRERTWSLWYRDDGEANWREIESAMPASRQIRPLAFDGDAALIVATRAAGKGTDRAALYRYDLASKTLGEPLFSHPWVDIAGGLIQQPGSGRVLGVRYSDDMPRTRWFEAQHQAWQEALDVALPKTTNTLYPSHPDAPYLLVLAESTTDAGTYYLFDTKRLTLERISAARDWLPPALMPERRYAPYITRDGLRIPAWLTLPRGAEAKNLPLIVHVHGGPWVRGYHGLPWGRRPTPLFLASRGYAVLEPEPRGSAGFGEQHYLRSMKQWGLSMQDDITDGALDLVKQGIVNRDRMCLFGGSYGGYAALQGLVRDPDLWRCGNAYVAVTDLGLLQTVSWSDTAAYSDYLDTDFKRRVGDHEADRAQFDATSPARNAHKIKAAVMLTMGGRDRRVPLIHGTRFRDAMEKAGKPFDYKVYSDETHGFNAPGNVIDFYTRTEQFFARHLGKP